MMRANIGSLRYGASACHVDKPKAWMVSYNNATGEPESANESKTDVGDEEKLYVSLLLHCGLWSLLQVIAMVKILTVLTLTVVTVTDCQINGTTPGS